VREFLLDTNVTSEMVNPPGPKPAVVCWLKNADKNLVFVSFLTFGEIRRGIESWARAGIILAMELKSTYSTHALQPRRGPDSATSSYAVSARNDFQRTPDGGDAPKGATPAVRADTEYAVKLML
jgi:hypothetical protein